jgi:hypothetical protein
LYLPDDDAKASELFINYIYRDRLPQYLLSSSKAEEMHPRFEMTHLHPLFFLAEKYSMNELKNKVMDAIQDFGAQHRILPGPKNITRIYTNTHEGSTPGLYSVLTRSSVRALSDGESEAQKLAYLASTTPDFVGDYLEAQFKYSARFRPDGVVDPRLRGEKGGFVRCFFHIHAKGEVCNLEGVGSGTK